MFLTERVSANKTVDVIGWIITLLAYVLAILTFPVSVFCCVKVRLAFVPRLGKINRKKCTEETALPSLCVLWQPDVVVSRLLE